MLPESVELEATWSQHNLPDSDLMHQLFKYQKLGWLEERANRPEHEITDKTSHSIRVHQWPGGPEIQLEFS